MEELGVKLIVWKFELSKHDNTFAIIFVVLDSSNNTILNKSIFKSEFVLIFLKYPTVV